MYARTRCFTCITKNDPRSTDTGSKTSPRDEIAIRNDSKDGGGSEQGRKDQGKGEESHAWQRVSHESAPYPLLIDEHTVREELRNYIRKTVETARQVPTNIPSFLLSFSSVNSFATATCEREFRDGALDVLTSLFRVEILSLLWRINGGSII